MLSSRTIERSDILGLLSFLSLRRTKSRGSKFSTILHGSRRNGTPDFAFAARTEEAHTGLRTTETGRSIRRSMAWHGRLRGFRVKARLGVN
jgi:hypothetical protein